MRLFAFILMPMGFYALACNNPAHRAAKQDTANPLFAHDTVLTPVTPPDTLRPVEATGSDYALSYRKGFLRVRNKSTGSVDSLYMKDEFEEEDSYPEITDLTNTLHFQPLLARLLVQGYDIYYQNIFVGYKKGKLQVLFKVRDDSDSGINFHRVDSNTLTAFNSGRDEVVGNLEESYPVSVDLRTMRVAESLPEKQYIGFHTQARELIKAHRLINGVVDSTLIDIKEGEEVMVDTLYRDRHKVRLILRDSIPVEVQIETAKKKLGHNAAG